MRGFKNMTFVGTGRCPNCGGPLTIQNEQTEMACGHCGTQLLIQNVVETKTKTTEYRIAVLPSETCLETVRDVIPNNGRVGGLYHYKRWYIQVDPNSPNLSSGDRKYLKDLDTIDSIKSFQEKRKLAIWVEARTKEQEKYERKNRRTSNKPSARLRRWAEKHDVDIAANSTFFRF